MTSRLFEPSEHHHEPGDRLALAVVRDDAVAKRRADCTSATCFTSIGGAVLRAADDDVADLVLARARARGRGW